MKTLLTVTWQGTALSFNSDGSVTSAGNAQAGTWNATSDASGAALLFQPAGASAARILVQYSLNPNNQLQVAIPAQPNVAPADATIIEGYIVVTDATHFAYYSIENDDPTLTAAGFYVIGAIAIDPGANVMTIDGGAAGQLKITGFVAQGSCALTPDQADGGLDLIEFSALTHNVLADGGAVDIPAQISIAGRWDIQDGQLKFGVQYANDGATPTMAIAIAGQLKGVAVGFEFHGGTNSRLLFTIAGEITGTDGNGNWSFSLGYSGNRLTAVGNIRDTIVTPDGSITFAGSFTVAKGKGALTFGVNLAATWTLANGQMSVAVSGSNRNYTLSLAGKLKVGANWDVSFQVAAGTNGSPSFSISVGSAQPNSALNSQLQLYFSGNQVRFSVNLEVSVQFVNGMLVPKPAAAGVTG